MLLLLPPSLLLLLPVQALQPYSHQAGLARCGNLRQGEVSSAVINGLHHSSHVLPSCFLV
jgi:hypothetical protein